MLAWRLRAAQLPTHRENLLDACVFAQGLQVRGEGHTFLYGFAHGPSKGEAGFGPPFRGRPLLRAGVERERFGVGVDGLGVPVGHGYGVVAGTFVSNLALADFYLCVPQRPQKRLVETPPGAGGVDHFSRQLEEMGQMGSLYQPGGLIFATKTGTIINPSNLRNRSFEPLLERANLPPIRFYDLRHT